MNPTLVDRDTFLQNLRSSKLLTTQQFRTVIDKLGQVQSPREIAKALTSWKLVTKFQARMLLQGRKSGFFIGPYRILDQLGQGGMGRVYKAMHQTMNRVVALKVLSPKVVGSARAQELFLREVQAAAQLSHPNIVMAFDANECDGRHFMSMEFVDGPNLECHVLKSGALPIGLACEVIFQAANGLHYAHGKGMVHRDIKPANLLLAQEPLRNTIHVKILDFGLARLQCPEGGPSRTIVARENTVMGTPDFVSPEQTKNLHDVDIRSDLYSLGCTFYFLLTGQVPFPGSNTVDKLIRQNADEPTPIEQRRRDVSAHVAGIIRKLWAKKPAVRFQSPDELMDALAPHAAPSVMDWPIATSAPSDRLSQENTDLGDDMQVATEPQAQSTTQIGEAESVLDWVEICRRRRLVRRVLISSGVIGLGLLALGAVAATAWATLGP